ncbi:MAG: 50S ribosomal protein L19 [Chitinivibrionales bacterium]
MSSNTIKNVEREYLIERDADFRAGDTVAVSFRISEGGKSRIQIFEGTVLKRKGQGLGATFTVRKHSGSGVYVERIFPVNSPLVTDINVVKRGKVRRSKIYYMRDRIGKATRIKSADKKPK